MSPQIPVILNPTAGGGRLLRQRRALEAAARAAGASLVWRPTSGPGHGADLARQAARDGEPLVLAFGGDGTYNEVAQGLVGSTTAMGVLPGGTSSVLAYELEVPRPARRALSALLAGEDRWMHVGRTSHGGLVLLMLSAGPDSTVLARLSPTLKRLGGRVGVAVQAVRELLSARPLPRLRAVTGDGGMEGGWAIVGNARCYGGPFQATPGADAFAAGFQLVLQTSVGRAAAVPFALSIPRRRHLLRRDVVARAVDDVLLEPVEAGARIPYQVDGDLVGTLPVRVRVDEARLRIRMPPGPAPGGPQPSRSAKRSVEM